VSTLDTDTGTTSLTLSRDQLGPNQACTLFGAKSGSNIIAGRSYIDVGFGLNASDLWRRNLLVMIAFVLAFQLTQVLALEYWPVSFVFNRAYLAF
jgi:ATP-binding cassette subfamily G (WHITE) protein 2 (SNQ2)